MLRPLDLDRYTLDRTFYTHDGIKMAVVVKTLDALYINYDRWADYLHQKLINKLS